MYDSYFWNEPGEGGASFSKRGISVTMEISHLQQSANQRGGGAGNMRRFCIHTPFLVKQIEKSVSSSLNSMDNQMKTRNRRLRRRTELSSYYLTLYAFSLRAPSRRCMSRRDPAPLPPLPAQEVDDESLLSACSHKMGMWRTEYKRKC